MKKQQIQISLSPDFKKSGLEVAKAKKAFTLVELIIVITILAILATIAFVSFSNYTKSARDANRVSTLTNLQKGLDIYSVQVGRLPVPENPQTFTGGLNGKSLINQGILTQEVLQTLSSTPVDPVTGKEYTYSTFGNGKYYQIAGNLETELSQNLGNQTYANTFQTAKLIGNYRYDPSLPSLIIGSGSEIFSPDTCFVVDGGSNTLENCTTKKSDLAGKTSDSSLVGYWDMESLCINGDCGAGNDGKLRDLSGNGNYGAFTGNVFPSSTGGFVGNAYNFVDSNNGSIDIPSSPTLEIEKALTISVIIKANKNELKGILTKQSTGRDNDNGTGCSVTNYCGYLMSTSENHLGGRIYDKDFFGEMNPQGTSLTTDRTSHGKYNYEGEFLVLHYVIENNNFGKVYINGFLLDNYNFLRQVREITVSKNPLKIGRYWNDLNGGVYEFFDGIIDEVKIYNRALTDEEILQQAKIAGF